MSPSLRLTVSDPSLPNPWPTPLIAIVAMPRCASGGRECAHRIQQDGLLARPATVAVDHDRPPIRRRSARREHQIEVDVVDTGTGWGAGTRADRRNVLTRVDLVITREKPAECDLTNRAWNAPDVGKRRSDRSLGRPGHHRRARAREPEARGVHFHPGDTRRRLGSASQDVQH